MMKRQRGRGRKPGGGGGGNHQPNRTLESTGPDVKIRGSAAHIYDKYMQLSRDASSAGDRVASESYLQHAEHYFRMLRAMQPQQMPVLDQRFNQEFDYEDESGDGEDGDLNDTLEGAEAEASDDQPYVQREQRPDRQGGRPPQREQQAPYANPERNPQPPRPEGQFGDDAPQAQGGDQEGFRNNRRRRNRGRYRPDGEGGGRGGDRGPNAPEGGDQAGPVEGFGEAVPAFVAGE
jgi:hypothetical protein